jgi:hypothetical protein
MRWSGAEKLCFFVRARTHLSATRIADCGGGTYLPSVWSWLALWAVSFALMNLYVGKIAVDEAIFAALGSAVTATASKIVLQKRIAPLRTQWRHFAQLWRVPKYVVVGTWEICAVLAKALLSRTPAPSLVHAVPFEAGGDDDESAFRRALAIAWTTATPNFVIIGIDRRRGLLVYHQVRKSKIPDMTKRLGARP